VNIADLTDHVAAAGNLSKAQAKQIIDGLFGAIVADAAKGGEISIPGFGKFKVASRPEREGRNPATGEMIKIAASRKLAFTPAKAVKDALNG
jgi:DNA-binding protein HU-beta